MRQAMIVMLAVGAVTAFATPSFAAQRQQAQYFCYPGWGCVPTTQQRHNECFSLALQRGLNVSRGDRHNLNQFLYQCIAGRIPR